MHTIKNIIVNVIKDPSNLPLFVFWMILIIVLSVIGGSLTFLQSSILVLLIAIPIHGFYFIFFFEAQTYKDVKNIIRDWWK